MDMQFIKCLYLVSGVFNPVTLSLQETDQETQQQSSLSSNNKDQQISAKRKQIKSDDQNLNKKPKKL